MIPSKNLSSVGSGRFVDHLDVRFLYLRIEAMWQVISKANAKPEGDQKSNGATLSFFPPDTACKMLVVVEPTIRNYCKERVTELLK